MNKKVSIVIPVYNAEAYLEQCLNSIVSQTYDNLEIICVDDGSTDNSETIINAFMQRDSRIKKIKQKNQYAGIARNSGMKIAAGDYIIFLDADDWFEPEMIEEMVQKAEIHNSDIVLCGSQAYDNVSDEFRVYDYYLDYSLIPEKDCFSYIDLGLDFFKLTKGWAWDKLYNFEFIKKLNIEFQGFKVANDENFVDITLAEASKISVVKKRFVNHRINNGNSLEANRYKTWNCVVEMLKKEKQDFEQRKIPSELIKAFMTDRVAQHLVWYLEDAPEDFSYYEEFYSYVKNKGFDDFGLDLTEIDNIHYVECLNAVKRNECRDFIYFWWRKTRKEQIDIIELQDKLVKERDNWLLELDDIRKKRDEIITNKKWIYRNIKENKNKKIILYGYGDVGKDIVEYISISYPEMIVGIIDAKVADVTDIHGFKFININDLDYYEYDTILITILNEKVSAEIRSTLIDIGVPTEKIELYKDEWIRLP